MKKTQLEKSHPTEKTTDKKQHKTKQLRTEAPIAEKDEEKQAEDELRQRIERKHNDKD